MTEKTLHNSDVSGARLNVPDIKVVGNGDTYRLLCKASSQNEGWMKSSKAMEVPGGCVVQVTTQQKNTDGSYAGQTLAPVSFLGGDGKTWPQTMDAVVWAKEFVETATRIPSIATDEGTMISWFANAIMAGYDEAQRRCHQPPNDRTERPARQPEV